MLITVAYASEITGVISDTDLRIILGQAQIKNRRLDVTGKLAYNDRHFLQVLEGRPASIDELLDRIGRNPRHQAIRLLGRSTITIRRFPAWSMALQRRDDCSELFSDLHQRGAQTESALSDALGFVFSSTV